MPALARILLLALALPACSPTPKAGAPSEDSAGDDGTGGGETGDGDTGAEDTAETGALTGSWEFDGDTVSVRATADEPLRTYTLTSTHPQRDGAPSERSFTEQAGDPRLRSGVLLTDALFALAVEEARQNAVSQITDAAFDGAVECECYQTGALWSWVWTRDIAYATELGLAWLDPERAARSLLFKVSRPKAGGALQIVQDTGTGGSWPVSTDRVAWARGAMAVLEYTDHAELRATAIEAMGATAAVDRAYAWDPVDGLYRGETSFLDWREQTYPRWVAEDTVHIGMSKSLSTNLGHLFLLRSLEALTAEAHGAAELAVAIDDAFWQDDHYASFLGTTLDGAPAARRDLLATSFAILDLGTHPEALTTYPYGAGGPPVVSPQQQLVPIYHNRGAWPFVTAYSVLAARAADNGAAFDAGLDSLVRGAALNLSHMENLEFATGDNWVSEGDTSGPVVNSQRQLWSVAGFLGAVAHGVFGLRGDGGGMAFDPVLPSGVWFTPEATLLMGEDVVSIGTAALSAGQVTWADTADWREVFGAQEPTVSLTGTEDAITLQFTGEDGATFQVYRDGARVAEDATSPWTDTATTTACYTVVAIVVHPSLPSAPLCWWGDGASRIQSVPATAFHAFGGEWSDSHGRGHYQDWGDVGHTLSFEVTPTHAGRHLVQAVYGNGAGGFATGVTAAVKRVEVSRDGNVEGEGALVMPHLGDWSRWGDSSFVPVELDAGVTYTVTVRDGFNMSYLDHYTDYVGGRGGGTEPSNYVNISEMKLLYRP
jgi:hypothetical protein